MPDSVYFLRVLAAAPLQDVDPAFLSSHFGEGPE